MTTMLVEDTIKSVESGCISQFDEKVHARVMVKSSAKLLYHTIDRIRKGEINAKPDSERFREYILECVEWGLKCVERIKTGYGVLLELKKIYETKKEDIPCSLFMESTKQIEKFGWPDAFNDYTSYLRSKGFDVERINHEIAISQLEQELLSIKEGKDPCHESELEWSKSFFEHVALRPYIDYNWFNRQVRHISF